MAWKILASLGAATVLLLGVGPLQADRTAPVPEPTIGFVDLSQVRQAMMLTPNWKVANQKLEDAKVRAENDLETLRKVRYLTTAERGEWEALRAKQKPTEPEKMRTAELEGKSDGLDREYSTLAQTEKPSAEQAARIKELDTRRKEGAAMVDREIERLTASLEKLQQDFLKEMAGKVQLVVEQVARQRKLSLVVDRQLVLVGGVDVTAEVLKQLK